jgi:hypothetical protein
LTVRPEDLLFWLRAQPFQPFRITTNSGRTYDVHHSELVRLMRTSLVYFTPSAEPDVFDRGEMIGLVLIDHIAPIDKRTTAPGDENLSWPSL